MTEYFQIELTQGQVARVSPEDWEELSQYRWHAWWSSHTKSFYAIRHVRTTAGRQHVERMHRRIMRAPENMQVDHVNGDTLDNRRSELRLATQAENARNRKPSAANTSGYKGVKWESDRSRWRACINNNGRRHDLGRYLNIEDALAAYRTAAARLHGEFARTA